MGMMSHDTNYFGLDIGNTDIRLVQLRKGGAKPALVTYGDIKVPAGLTTSDSALDADKVAGIIRQLAAEARVTTKQVVAGLPSASVYSAIITTPVLSASDLSKAIHYQADQYIPMALDQVKLDWAVVGPGKNDKEQDVLLVAAPNTVAAKYTNIFEKAGLEILALETNATAISRALVAKGPGLAVMILDMGSGTSDLTVVYDNAPRLIRSMPVGGATFVRAVSQNLGLDETQAYQFTYKFGLTQTKLEGQVYKAIKPSLDNLITEIQKSAKFFQDRYPEVKLEKIIVTGSTVALPELTTYLANSTGLPIEIGNAWINVAYPASLQDKLMSLSIQYAVASGLAQRMFV
jgi:type IV pilus assembly protein PilM